jgi:hypothetical protein
MKDIKNRTHHEHENGGEEPGNRPPHRLYYQPSEEV